ncbi:MAG: endonuclease NucS [Paeniclostridium sordellii]|nr:endonuclease NucS [Paeniclostridium sordellii]
MGDIKLFKIKDEVEEIEGTSMQLEKHLQNIIEENMEVFLGVKFLATEYSTGKVHNGRIDSLGIDENNCPVIIEYKRSINENVINQGLYYLDWLLDHKAEFKLLVMEKLGVKYCENIEWSSPRLICIANDFTKYDIHAVKQINRNIDLIKYKNYKEELLLLEMVHTNTVSDDYKPIVNTDNSTKHKYKTVEDYLEDANNELKNRYYILKDFIMSLGDDVQEKKLKNYFGFKRIKNFACIEIHPKTDAVLVYTKANIKDIEIKEGFTRDVTDIGHYGTGNLEIKFTDMKQLDEVQKYILKSYEMN